MKKYLVLFLVFLLCGNIACAEVTVSPEPTSTAEAPVEEALPAPDEIEGPREDSAGVSLWFEEGFELTLPEGWVSYPVSEADSVSGTRYALGDGTLSHFLYIQFNETTFTDIDALHDAVWEDDAYSKVGTLDVGGRQFVAFIDAERNISCSATLLGDELMLLLFAPQNDPDFMLTATRILETFRET